jgi:hypothetical protein
MFLIEITQMGKKRKWKKDYIYLGLRKKRIGLISSPSFKIEGVSLQPLIFLGLR